MAARSYNQYCPLAHALDLLGERWTLLVVRELMLGPRRYTDLLAGLPGIGTDLLASRLRRLGEHGVVEVRALPPPAQSVRVYELTELGWGLEPAVAALARWGFLSLGSPQPTQLLRAEWVMMAPRTRFQPEHARGVDATYEFRVDDEIFHIRVEDERATAHRGGAPSPTLVFSGDSRTIAAIGARALSPLEAAASGALEVEGDLAELPRVLSMFGLLGAPGA